MIQDFERNRIEVICEHVSINNVCTETDIRTYSRQISLGVDQDLASETVNLLGLDPVLASETDNLLGLDPVLASETDNLPGCGPGPGLRGCQSLWVWTRSWPQRLSISLGLDPVLASETDNLSGCDPVLASETDNLSGCGPGPGLRD